MYLKDISKILARFRESIVIESMFGACFVISIDFWERFFSFMLTKTIWHIYRRDDSYSDAFPTLFYDFLRSWEENCWKRRESLANGIKLDLLTSSSASNLPISCHSTFNILLHFVCRSVSRLSVFMMSTERVHRWVLANEIYLDLLTAHSASNLPLCWSFSAFSLSYVDCCP